MKLLFAAGAASALLLFSSPLEALAQQDMSQAQVRDEARETTSTDKKSTKTIANKICPVSKEEIGSMGPGKKVTHKGYEFKLCCAGCLEEFNKNPDAYLRAALQSGKAKPNP